MKTPLHQGGGHKRTITRIREEGGRVIEGLNRKHQTQEEEKIEMDRELDGIRSRWTTYFMGERGTGGGREHPTGGS